jgi:hypothetical protein
MSDGDNARAGGDCDSVSVFDRAIWTSFLASGCDDVETTLDSSGGESSCKIRKVRSLIALLIYLDCLSEIRQSG